MSAFDNLQYAQFVRYLLDAADELEKACCKAVGAKNDELFKISHDAKMKLLETVGNLIKNPKEEIKKDDKIIMDEFYQGQVQHMGENSVVVLYEVDGKLLEQTYERSQFKNGEFPAVGTVLSVHVEVREVDSGNDEFLAS